VRCAERFWASVLRRASFADFLAEWLAAERVEGGLAVVVDAMRPGCGEVRVSDTIAGDLEGDPPFAAFLREDLVACLDLNDLLDCVDACGGNASHRRQLSTRLHRRTPRLTCFRVGL
jgi:hypothetical protein